MELGIELATPGLATMCQEILVRWKLTTGQKYYRKLCIRAI